MKKHILQMVLALVLSACQNPGGDEGDDLTDGGVERSSDQSDSQADAKNTSEGDSNVIKKLKMNTDFYWKEYHISADILTENQFSFIHYNGDPVEFDIHLRVDQEECCGGGGHRSVLMGTLEGDDTLSIDDIFYEMNGQTVSNRYLNWSLYSIQSPCREEIPGVSCRFQAGGASTYQSQSNSSVWENFRDIPGDILVRVVYKDGREKTHKIKKMQ